MRNIFAYSCHPFWTVKNSRFICLTASFCWIVCLHNQPSKKVCLSFYFYLVNGMKSRKYEKPNRHYSISQKLCGTDHISLCLATSFSPGWLWNYLANSFIIISLRRVCFLKQARVENFNWRSCFILYPANIYDKLCKAGFNSQQRSNNMSIKENQLVKFALLAVSHNHLLSEKKLCIFYTEILTLKNHIKCQLCSLYCWIKWQWW